ncbi:MAG: hypothetical protein HKN30_05955 [Sulfitobacter sp.]|nr:hypothetical protein [Sulfitobacter sp.]
MSIYSCLAALALAFLPINGANAGTYNTPSKLIELFEQTCLVHFPNFDAAQAEARRKGFNRVSPSQSEIGNTITNVVTYIHRNKAHCLVTGHGLSPEETAKALTATLAMRGATGLKIRSNRRVGQGKLILAGRKVTILSQPELASTRIPGVKITLSQ